MIRNKKKTEQEQDMSIRSSDESIGETSGKFPIGVGVAGILLVFEVFALLCRIFSGYWSVLADIPVIMDDASVFLNLVCISWIIYAVVKGTGSPMLYVLYALDLVFVNHLYSNETWASAVDFIRQNWREVLGVLVVVALLVGIAFISVRTYKNNQAIRKRNQDKRAAIKRTAPDLEPARGIQTNHGTNDAVDSEKRTAGAEEKTASKSSGTGNNAEENENNYEKETRNPIIAITYSFGILSIVLFAVDIILFEWLDTGFQRVEFIENNINVIQLIEILCAVIAAVVFLARMIYACASGAKDLKVRGGTAIVAAILEIIVLILMDKIVDLDFTSKFLNALSGNVFGIFIIVVITYLVIHISVIILSRLIFRSDNQEEKEITVLLKNSIHEIERKIVEFSCNIISGIVNLFCFIPDFFNTIGYILLDEEKNIFSLSPDSDTESKGPNNQAVHKEN